MPGVGKMVSIKKKNQKKSGLCIWKERNGHAGGRAEAVGCVFVFLSHHVWPGLTTKRGVLQCSAEVVAGTAARLQGPGSQGCVKVHTKQNASLSSPRKRKLLLVRSFKAGLCRNHGAGAFTFLGAVTASRPVLNWVRTLVCEHCSRTDL